VLQKYPKLKIVTVENEVGWMPFMFQQWDYYYRRFRGVNPPPITRDPSDFVREQIYACFFNDSVCGHNLEWWGRDNVMWSNDFPHPNSTWPNSIKIIERDLGHLAAETQAKVLYQNVCRLYGINAARLPKVTPKPVEGARATA
jgi:predicted TIM-barrel fold metal-dependent hydrolase